jgi:hypothetical protein
VLQVFILHSTGFALGYFVSKGAGVAGAARSLAHARYCCAYKLLPLRIAVSVPAGTSEIEPAPGEESDLMCHGWPAALGLSNKIARTNSIEVGMQSSALAVRRGLPLHTLHMPCARHEPDTWSLRRKHVALRVRSLQAVLARVHFASDPVVVAPCVLSACTHATLGSLLAGYWSATLKDPDA